METATSAKQRRKYIDCRDYPSDKQCTLRLSGTEDEVFAAARQHAVNAHGRTDSPELTDELGRMIRDERDLT